MSSVVASAAGKTQGDWFGGKQELRRFLMQSRCYPLNQRCCVHHTHAWTLHTRVIIHTHGRYTHACARRLYRNKMQMHACIQVREGGEHPYPGVIWLHLLAVRAPGGVVHHHHRLPRCAPPGKLIPRQVRHGALEVGCCGRWAGIAASGVAVLRLASLRLHLLSQLRHHLRCSGGGGARCMSWLHRRKDAAGPRGCDGFSGPPLW